MATFRGSFFLDPRKSLALYCPRTGSNGSLLIVSQFTLWGDCRRGRRPSFSHSAPPEKAEPLYNLFIRKAKEAGLTVTSGRFQAMMEVQLINDGPVTLLLDSQKAF